MAKEFRFFTKDSEKVLTLDNFKPFACHLNENTILTKNGELIHTIKIPGSSSFFDNLQEVDLRGLIKEFLGENIKNYNFSIYFHTIRNKKHVDDREVTGAFFADKLHSQWVKKNYLDDKYINDIYISFIHYGLDFPSFKSLNFLRSIFFRLEKDYHASYLTKSVKKLENISNLFLENFQKYGAKKLGLTIDKNGVKSENLEFFSKILSIDNGPCFLPIDDLSKYLSNYRLKSFNDYLEISSTNKTSFLNIFSFKQHYELSTNSLTRILQLPIDLIITQSVHFISNKKARKNFEYQNYIYNLTRNEEMKIISSINGFFENLGNLSPNFAVSQTNFQVTAEKLDDLRKSSSRLYQLFAELGMLVFKEDLNLERCLWSNLPGNLNQIIRKSIISKKNIGSYLFLDPYNSGKMKNKWGRYVAILRNIMGYSYYFNFHDDRNGHNLLIGQKNTGRKTFVNFLLSESMKFSPLVTIIEEEPDSEIFVKFLSGNYSFPHITLEQNLFSTIDHSVVKIFLKIINRELSPSEIEILSNILTGKEEDLKNVPQEIIDHLINFLSSKDFTDYVSEKKLEFANIQGICVGSDLEEKKFIPLKTAVLQALHNCTKQPKDSPKILVIDSTEKLLDDYDMTEILLHYLDKIDENNGIVIFICGELKTEKMQENFSRLSKKMANIMHSAFSQKKYATKEKYGLEKEEFEEILSWNLLNRNFLLKTTGATMIIELSLSSIKEKILLSSTENFRKLYYNLPKNLKEEEILSELMKSEN